MFRLFRTSKRTQICHLGRQSVTMLRPLRVLVCVCATIGLAASVALAQPALPDATLTAQPLTSQDEQAIQAFVTPLLNDLLNGEAPDAQAARTALVTPALGETSVGFRLYYSQQLLPEIQEAAGFGADPQRMQLLMSVAGAVATDAARAMLLDAIEDERVVVRFGAAREFGVLLEQIDKGQGHAAINQGAVTATIDELQEWLANEPNPLVASAIAKAMASPSQTQSLKIQSLTAMCTSMARQADRRAANLAQRDDVFEDVVALLRIFGPVQQNLIQLQIEGQAPQSLNDAAAQFASASARFADEALNNPNLSNDGRVLANQLKTAAANLSQLASP